MQVDVLCGTGVVQSLSADDAFQRIGSEARFRGARLSGDFGVVAMVRLLIGLLVVGGRRLDHVGYVADDPVFRRFCRLQVLPTARTVSRWLTQFTMKTVERLQALNAAVIAHVIPGLRLHTVTVDVDGVVVSTGLQVERAFRGFNPHHRKVPSYYPIMAHLAETTHVLRVKNRSGNVHDGKASLPFLRELWTQLTSSRYAGLAAPISHGWGLFPPGCTEVAHGARCGLCASRSRSITGWTCSSTSARKPTWTRVSGGRQWVRGAGRDDSLGPAALGGDLSEEGPASDRKELPTGPVRPG